MELHKVTSEIFTERENYVKELPDGGKISKFFFKYPSFLLKSKSTFDEDEDLDICRDQKGEILIEHDTSTELKLVGLQLWRGAFLLADYILSNPQTFKHKTILEVGSGVGLTSIVASFLATKVICTDINLGGILKLIERNFQRNEKHVKSNYSIDELNFQNLKWTKSFEKKFNEATIILAADVIYDDEITAGFVNTLVKLLKSETQKTVYISLEKRFVFSVTELDTVAPMYEEFLRCIEKQKQDWIIENIDIDFPRYFEYDRVRQMILLKIQNRSNKN